MLVTDGHGEEARILDLVAACVEGGLRVVQLREPSLSPAALSSMGAKLQAILAPVDGMVFLNLGRDDSIAAEGASGVVVDAAFDGMHLPQRLVSMESPPNENAPFGCAAHDPISLAAAQRLGALYATLSPMHPTTSKPEARPLGLAAAGSWTEAVQPMHVVWLGGMTVNNLHATLAVPVAQRPWGVAVLSGLADAADPEREAVRYLEILSEVLPR